MKKGKRQKIESLGQRHTRQETISGYLFISPLLLIFIIFTGASIFTTIFYLAFTKYNIMSSPEWVGLDNFTRMLQDPAARQMAWNIIRLPLYLVPAHTVVGLLFAYMVYKIKNRFLKYLSRTAIDFPVVATTASVAVAWGFLYNRDFGAINWILKTIGIIEEGIPWTNSTQYAIISIVIFSIWKFIGIHFLYYIIGLQNIPETYYEAAKIDGANEFQVFFKITLPLLSSSVFYVILTCMIGSMQCFDEPFFITGGGPGVNTKTVAIYIYETAFQSYEMGYASAIAAVLFVVVFMFTALQLWLQKKWVIYDYE